MADRYWVGGSGNWSDATNHWSDSSGGSPGVGFLPTSVDNVIFDAASNTGTNPFTVTVDGTSSSPSLCNDFSTGGAGGALDGAMTLQMGATSQLNCYGSMTLPATNFTSSPTSGAAIFFKATTTGKTITTNGVALGVVALNFDGAGGEWTFGSAISNTANSNFLNGSLVTANYSYTTNAIVTSATTTRSIALGSSTVTLAGTVPINITGTSNLTWNAGTSTITCSNTSPTFTGGGLTFYNVTFSSGTSGTKTINGANTFNNLTVTSVGGTGLQFVVLGANQTVSGTLTLGAANTAIRRMRVVSDAVGTRRTITLNGTLATLADVDFRDIGAAGTVATPWTGTRLGDLKNNNNITFDAPKTVYWNLAGTQNWSATGWATTNNGVPAVNNFPLAQDTAVFTEAGAAGTVTIEANWQIGSIQMADGVSNRTTAFTLATGSVFPAIYGNVTLFSNLTFTGSANISFAGQGVTQTITSAGISWPQPLTATAFNGTFQLADNLTNTGTTFTLTSGTLDLNNNTLTCVAFSSSNSNTRSIAFGTGQITVTGNNATVWNTATATNFTYTGTSNVRLTYSGSVGTRTFTHGTTAGGTESNSLNVSVTAGTDTLAFGGGGLFRNLILTGFAGTLGNSTRTIYGNLTISSGMTVIAGSSPTTFAATSGTQDITTNGVSLDFPMAVNAPGATVRLQDNLTIGSTRTFTLTAGTLDLNTNKTLNCGAFASSNSNVRVIAFGTSGVINCQGNFTATTGTNLTTTGTGKIKMSSASTKTFSGGGRAYPVIEQAGAGTLVLTGANTFADITNTNATASQITFPASTTTTVKGFTLSGTAGNLVLLRSSTPGTQFILSYSP